MAVELSKALKDITSIREKEVRTHHATPRHACTQQPARAGQLIAASHCACCLPACLPALVVCQSAVFEQINKEQELSHFSNGQPHSSHATLPMDVTGCC